MAAAGTGALAATHFIERGFRHFAFFGAPWMLWSQERERGFQAEIERVFAARAAEGRVADVSYSFAAYGADERAFRESHRRRSASMGAWLKSLPQPAALFVASDTWGFELVQAAREMGLHVPEEVAILGVDNEELLCEIVYPPLSSIPMGSEQMGHNAVTILERLLHGLPPGPELPRVAPLDVVTRQSTDTLAVEDPEVAAALWHIRHHAASGLSVKQLLEAVPINRRTLERRFVSMLGHTPLEEIHQVRLERVKTLLGTDLPIYQIASQCGFRTPEHMATTFLKAVGQTPTAFRSQRSPAPRWRSFLPLA